jgi:hypothetical protein
MDVDHVGIVVGWGYVVHECTVFESYNWADSIGMKGVFPVVHRPTTTALLSIKASD